MAEGVGFEPTELSLNGFQDRRLKPLGHPSTEIGRLNSISNPERQSFYPRQACVIGSGLSLLHVVFHPKGRRKCQRLTIQREMTNIAGRLKWWLTSKIFCDVPPCTKNG